MKTYVITLSKKFLCKHPRAGEETNFAQAFRAGQTCSKCKERKPAMCAGECFSDTLRKIHTIRSNYPLWEKRINEVSRGQAVLSIRQWTGAPYRSKQVEIARLTASDGVGIQKITFFRLEWNDGKVHYCYDARMFGYSADLDKLALNDGFEDAADFLEWFDPVFDNRPRDMDVGEGIDMAIIHFTKFRYE